MVGKTVSHYKILDQLASGGRGIVYKAQDLKLDRLVVLKFLPPELTRDPETKKRFIREAQAASSLQHNNICTVHDIEDVCDGQMFICMDFYEGETLRDRLARGPLPIDEAVDIALQVAEGLAEAHAHNIVHRDIKPANIIITAHGAAKILDFGLAKLAGRTVLTQAGVTMGTVAYMSPEQARGEEVDHRTDIWSFGVTIYEMLAGERAFKGDYDNAVLYSVLHHEPEPITVLRPHVPAQLVRLVNKSLRKDPSERYPMMSNLLRDLRELKAGTGLRASISTSLSRSKGMRYGRTAAVALGLALTGVAAYLLAGRVFLGPQVPDWGSPMTAWENSVAVLPFKDFSATRDQEYLCDAMTDAIINNLTRVGRLKAISLTSVMRYKDTDKDVRVIGSELDVAHILEGSLQREADRIRVRAQLVRADNGRQVWSQTFDRALHSVFEVQDQISGSIVAALDLAAPAPTGRREVRQHAGNMETYDYYVKGMYFLKSRYVLTFKEEDFQSSLEMFNRASALDSLFAPAYFGLAWAYEFHYQVTSNEEDSKLIQENAEVAVSLDPSSALSHATLGYALYEYQHEREKAFDHFRTALRINANSSEVNFLVGVCYLYHGLYEAGTAYLSKSLQLDPYFFWIPYKLAVCQMHSGQFEKSAEQFEKYFELAPVEPLLYPGQYVRLNIWRGRYHIADSILSEGERRTPNAKWVNKYRAMLYAVAGEEEKALALYRNSEIYALLGMNDEALNELGREIRGTVPQPYIFYEELQHNPCYNGLRGDSRYAAILERERRIHHEEAERFGNLQSFR